MGAVDIYDAGGLISENNQPTAEAAKLRDLLLALNKPTNIAIVVGEGPGQSPQAVAGLLQKGWLVIQWTGFPFFYYTGSYALSPDFGRITGVSPFSTVIDQWVQKPLPPPQDVFDAGSYLANGDWDFNPLDFKFGQDVRDIYPYSRAFITRSVQSNTAIPFHSAPTSNAFPNFNFPYNGTHYYGYSGIMALCANNGLYFWCASEVPVYNVAEFVAQSAFGTNITAPGHVSPSSSSHPSTSTSTRTSTTTSSDCLYTVQSGDTLSSIAAKFKMSLGQLESLNPVDTLASHNYNTIYPGETIRVCGTESRTSTPTTTTPTYVSPTTSTPTTSTPTTSTNILGLNPTEERDLLIGGVVILGLYLIGKNL